MSKPRGGRYNDNIDDCIPLRWKQLGFKNFKEYTESLISFDLCRGASHDITGDIHRLPTEEQDRIYAEIARAYKAGETLGGGWLAHQVKIATEAAGLPEQPPKSKIAAKFREGLTRKPKPPEDKGEA